MSTGWDVIEETRRPKWQAAPLESVGPLRFGMTADEVESALDGSMASYFSRTLPGLLSSARYELVDLRPVTPAVTVYFDASGALMCVAAHALAGPQITLSGMPLVGRIPSRLEVQFAEYLTAEGLDLRYSQMADYGSEDLGLVVRVQRAGDIMLTRPVFVAREWAECCCDTSEGYIPTEEWHASW